MLLTSQSISCLPSFAPTSGRTRTLTITLPFPSLCDFPSFCAPSSPSSAVVALVAYDPCGDEFRLCGGEGRLRCPLSIATESALPLSRLGGERGDFGSKPRPPPTFEARGFLRLLSRGGSELFGRLLGPAISPPGVELVESGLEGLDLVMCLGGCGKEPMLTVLRKDFPAGNVTAGLLSSGDNAVGTGDGGSFEADGER